MEQSIDKLREEHLLRQKNASDPEYSVWVSANAGAGKTHILVERIIRLLLPPCNTPPNKILCITYTKAAASEMTERLFKRLGEWITKSDNELKDDIFQVIGRDPDQSEMIAARRLFARALETPGGLKIQTIHGFCEQILRRFPIESGYRKDFTVLTDYDKKMLYQKALDRLLKESLISYESELKTSFNKISEHYKLHDLLKIITDVTTIKTYNDFKKDGKDFWNSERLLDELKLPSEETFDNLLSKFLNLIDPQQIQAVISAYEDDIGVKATAIAAKLKHLMLDDIFSFNSWMDIFTTKSGDLSKEGSILFKKAEKKYPDITEYLRKLYDNFKECLNDYSHIETYRLTKALSFVILKCYEIVDDLKSEQGLCDFEDLIIRARELLSNDEIAPWVLWKLDGGIDHILIDEAQDTSGEQWEIVKAIANEFFANSFDDRKRTIFAVGDEKQSIYSFQGAEPVKMSQNAQHFQEIITISQQKWTIQELRGSFRSAPAILKLTDSIFQGQAKNGVLFSDNDFVRHYAVSNLGPGYIEVMPLSIGDDDSENDNWDNNAEQALVLDGRVKNAKRIAKKIKELIQSGEILPSTKQPIEPRDILILLRSRSSDMRLLIRELNSIKVPVTGIDRISMLEEIAVLDLLALIDFVLFPDDDLTLAQILRSPLCTINEEELFDLCYQRTSTLWISLEQKQSEKEHYQQAYNFLKDLLSKSDYESPHDFLCYVLENYQGRQKFTYRLGDDCLDAIDELLNKSLSFVTSHSPSLQRFVSYVRQTGGSQKREIDSSDNRVRIMTVHGAKGLEAPIVFLADAGKKPSSTARLSQKILLTRNQVPICLKVSPATELVSEEKKFLNQSEIREYRRLLYVAVTRAKDWLFVGGYLPKKSAGSKSSDNDDDETSEKKESTKTWYDYIIDGITTLEGHEILVEENITTEKTYFYKDCHDILSEIPYKPISNKAEPTLLYPQSQNIPAWLMNPVLQGKNQEAITLSPSKLFDDTATSYDQEARQKGIMTHKLLEIIPFLGIEQQETAAKNIVKNFNIPDAVKQSVLQQVLSLIKNPKYEVIFSKNGLSEAGVAGNLPELNNRKISGQIDRMVVLETEVLIVDYKSDKNLTTNNIPKKYILQMAFYRTAVQNIYPDKLVRCFILLISTTEMIELSDASMIESLKDYYQKAVA